MIAPRAPFDEAPPAVGPRTVASASVMLGSLVTIVPLVATVPLLPPVGLMILLAWRLRRPELFAIWAPLLLGLFDDLVSGQPTGSAMLLWTLCFFAIDLVERRVMMFRHFSQDWLVAAGGIAGCLFLGRLIAAPLAASVDLAVLAQGAVAVALYPLAAGLVARLDAERTAA